MTSLRIHPLALGAAGLIPFVASAAGVYASPIHAALFIKGLLFYGATILAFLGGVHWGLATDGTSVFAPINDPFFGGDPKFVSRAGVYAFDVETGKRGWSYAALPDCEGERGKRVSNCKALYGFSAAPLVIGDAVIAATLGGQVIVFDRENGELLNTIDTVGPIATINADIPGKGGSIDSHGLSAGAGMIFVNSGYSAFSQTPGNVFIALAPAN